MFEPYCKFMSAGLRFDASFIGGRMKTFLIDKELVARDLGLETEVEVE